jgi:hypothetical protein
LLWVRPGPPPRSHSRNWQFRPGRRRYVYRARSDGCRPNGRHMRTN